MRLANKAFQRTPKTAQFFAQAFGMIVQKTTPFSAQVDYALAGPEYVQQKYGYLSIERVVIGELG